MAFTRVNQDAPARWTSASFTYTFPSGAPSAGQLDVIGVDLLSSATLTIPSGWSSLSVTGAGATVHMYLLWKIAGAGDPSTVALNSGQSGGDEAILNWARYSAAGTITADTGAAVSNSSAASSSPSNTVTLAGSGELVVAYVPCANGPSMSGITWSTGYATVTSGNDGGFGGVSDVLGEDLSASGSQTPVASWTSGTFAVQGSLVQPFIETGGQTVSGAVSALALAAPAGTTSQPVVGGSVSALALAAPAGTPAGSGAATIAGAVGPLTLAALAGTPSAGSSGGPLNLDDSGIFDPHAYPQGALLGTRYIRH